MYLNFYNMAKAPFHITPDPEFLFLSPSHKEALGALIYCIEARKGFVSVIGEVGTGKTTIVRSYLAKSNRNQIKPIYVFNPAVTFAELLKTMFQEMGVTPHNESVHDMVQQLHAVLIKEYTQGRKIVLIVDEAQNMSASTFEQLRILSNLETPKDKLLQIVLVGQPELADKLSSKELRQLNQRLAVRATLLPLSPKESHDYILFRLSQVTPSPHEIFTSKALKKIIKAAQGSPRMLNILCDNALIAGFGYKATLITGAIVKQVIADFEGRKRFPILTWKYGYLLLALLFPVAVLSELHDSLPFAEFSFARHEPLSTSNSLSSIITKALHEQPLSSPDIDISRNVSGAETSWPSPKVSSEKPMNRNSTGADRVEQPDDNDIIAVTESNKEKVVPSLSSSTGKKVDLKLRKVKKGEHLSQICLDVYGYVNDRIIQVVIENNPRIFDPDLIFIGDTIFFPEISQRERSQMISQGG